MDQYNLNIPERDLFFLFFLLHSLLFYFILISNLNFNNIQIKY